MGDNFLEVHTSDHFPIVTCHMSFDTLLSSIITALKTEDLDLLSQREIFFRIQYDTETHTHTHSKSKFIAH